MASVFDSSFLVLSAMASLDKEREALHKLLVHGYIRRNCIVYEVPQVLVELCSLMSVKLYEKWNEKISNSDFIFTQRLKSDGQICRLRKGQRSINKWRNSFGCVMVESGESHEWNLRIVNVASSAQFGSGRLKRSVMLGVVNTSYPDIGALDSYFCESKYQPRVHGYAFYAYDGCVFCNKAKKRKYGQPWDQNDVITVTLDLTQEKGRLSFKINDKAQGIAFDDIDTNHSYCLAMSFFYDEEIEIIN